MMVWDGVDNKIYQIIFNAEKSKFDDHLPVVPADDRLVKNTAPIGSYLLWKVSIIGRICFLVSDRVLN